MSVMQHGLEMQFCKVLKQKDCKKPLEKEKALQNHVEKISKFKYQRITKDYF